MVYWLRVTKTAVLQQHGCHASVASFACKQSTLIFCHCRYTRCATEVHVKCLSVEPYGLENIYAPLQAISAAALWAHLRPCKSALQQLLAVQPMPLPLLLQPWEQPPLTCMPIAVARCPLNCHRCSPAFCLWSKPCAYSNEL